MTERKNVSTLRKEVIASVYKPVQTQSIIDMYEYKIMKISMKTETYIANISRCR